MDPAPYDIYRNATSLVFTPSDTDALLVSDALDSVLLAQLEAGKKADPFKDMKRWDHARLATLGRMQWAVTSSMDAESEQDCAFTLAGLLALEVPLITAKRLTEVLATQLLPEAWVESLWARTGDGRVQVRANIVEVRRTSELAWTTLSFAASSRLGWCGPYGATGDEPVTVRIVRSTHAFNEGAEGYAQIREKVITALGALRYSQNHRIAINAIHKA